VRPELKPLLEYLARLTFEDLMREASVQTSANEQQGDVQRQQQPDLPRPRSAA
jgi:hypothetical protein